MASWRESSDNWFDGTITSVDARLRHCNRLIAAANTIVGRVSIDDSRPYLTAAQELSADKQALAGLREELLTGGFGREAAGVPSPGRTAAKTATPDLAPQERRWVDLESARFLQANTAVAKEPGELAERARCHAEAHTSALGPRSEAVTAAFVNKVASLGRAMPSQRTAAVGPRVIPDFASELMFL
jgi:hypothetical protein